MTKLEKIRQAVADYMWSEGCSCCRAIGRHKENARRLAKLLDVPEYEDQSGYKFSLFRSKRRANHD